MTEERKSIPVDNPGDIAKLEAILKRTEEIKRDSIKIKLLEDISSKLGLIHTEMKELKESLNNEMKKREVEKDQDRKARKEYYAG